MKTIRTLAFLWLLIVMLSSAGFYAKTLYDFSLQGGNPVYLASGAIAVFTSSLIAILAVLIPRKA